MPFAHLTPMICRPCDRAWALSHDGATPALACTICGRQTEPCTTEEMRQAIWRAGVRQARAERHLDIDRPHAEVSARFPIILAALGPD